MKRAKIIAAVVLVVLAVIVFFQNTETAKTQILFMTMEMPRALLLLLTFAIGFVVGFVSAGIVSRKLRSDKR